MGHQHRCFAILLSLLFEQVRRVGDRRACPHCRGDYGCFRQHRVICAGLTRCFHMQLNAVRTLRCQRNSYRHQLLCRTILEEHGYNSHASLTVVLRVSQSLN
jgi:hypothetical protein